MDQIKSIHIKFQLAFPKSQVVLHTIIILKHAFAIKEKIFSVAIAINLCAGESCI